MKTPPTSKSPLERISLSGLFVFLTYGTYKVFSSFKEYKEGLKTRQENPNDFSEFKATEEEVLSFFRLLIDEILLQQEGATFKNLVEKKLEFKPSEEIEQLAQQTLKTKNLNNFYDFFVAVENLITDKKFRKFLDVSVNMGLSVKGEILITFQDNFLIIGKLPIGPIPEKIPWNFLTQLQDLLQMLFCSLKEARAKIFIKDIEKESQIGKIIEEVFEDINLDLNVLGRIK